VLKEHETDIQQILIKSFEQRFLNQDCFELDSTESHLL